jgi:hypothetical protein
MPYGTLLRGFWTSGGDVEREVVVGPNGPVAVVLLAVLPSERWQVVGR